MLLQRLVTLSVWTLVGGLVTLLLLRLLPQPLQAPPGVLALAPDPMAPAALSRLFGAAPELPSETQALPTDGRFKLLGVVAPREPGLQTQEGVALLSVDGGPPKAFRVGQLVDGRLRLLAVEARAVGLGESNVVQLQLRVDALPVAATGNLPLSEGLVAPPPAAVQLPAPPGQLPVVALPSAPLPQVQMPSLPERGSDSSGPRRPPMPNRPSPVSQ